MNDIFLVGIGLVLVTFVIGLVAAKPYTDENFQQMASTQRKLCISYVIGFGAIAFGGTTSLGGAWWAWLIIGLSSMMAFGALLEAMKTLPNAPKELQKD